MEVGIKWMRAIFMKLDLNPDTATFADIEQCEARLRCMKCAEVGSQGYAYTWEAAVSVPCAPHGLGRDADTRPCSIQFAHTAEHNTTYAHDAHPQSSHDRWGRIGKGDMARVERLEVVAHDALTVDSNWQRSCALCVGWPGEGGKGKWSVREHLASE